METQNLIFSKVVVSILLGFCFRLNIFTIKISNLLLPLLGQLTGAVNLDISNKYIYDVSFSMIYLSIFVAAVVLFVVLLQRT